jgi:hypothetical protein
VFHGVILHRLAVRGNEKLPHVNSPRHEKSDAAAMSLFVRFCAFRGYGFYSRHTQKLFQRHGGDHTALLQPHYQGSSTVS